MHCQVEKYYTVQVLKSYGARDLLGLPGPVQTGICQHETKATLKVPAY